MARKILVADRDPVYAQALARRIQKHCPACLVATVSDEAAFQDALAKAAGQLSLVVSAAHFPVDTLPAGVSQLILLETRFGSEALESPVQPVRLGSVQPILDRLDLAGSECAVSIEPGLPAGQIIVPSGPAGFVQQPAGLASAPLAPHDPDDDPAPMPDPSNPPVACANQMPSASEPERLHRVILMLTQTTTGREPAYADQRCLELGRNGDGICYLPLMPNYYCRHANSCSPENGFGLTNLLLRIAGGGLTPGELGAYMAVDSLGRMQVRPCDRADDLLECRPHDLFQLVTQLRERTLADQRSLLVIEAAGIPFRSVQAIMPLCDAVEVVMPDDSGQAGQALRRELGEVLADLPASARMTQVPEHRTQRRPVPNAANGPANAASGKHAAEAPGTRDKSRVDRHVPA